MFIYSASLVMLMLIGISITSLHAWQPYDSLYKALKVIDNNKVLVITILILLGLIIFFAHYWKKTLSYLELVVEATNDIYFNKNEFIQLPPELKDIENQLNHIKSNIQKSNYAAREAEQRKNDLIVYLAHDLKTPLTSVLGYLTLLRDEKDISCELKSHYLTIATSKAQRLEDLINEFFEITRFNLTNIELCYSNINLTLMIEQLASEFAPMLQDKNLTFRFNLQHNIEIKCDPDKLQRVFDNIIRNAINYSFDNGIIDITLTEKNNEVEIIFTNDGNTISPEKLERIFEQFYRLDVSRATNSGGSGLGLAIAKEIILLHKGKIIANSENDKITFKILLPNGCKKIV